MAVDKDMVKRVARLARIAVPDDEAAVLTDDLNSILAFVEQLDGVDVADVEPMTSAVTMTMRIRLDEVSDGGNAERVLANAPVRQDNFFAVPKVIE